MVRLFIHLLLTANYETKGWKGIEIPRGSVVTSRAKLSAETTLSEREVRTCLNRLKTTNEITIKTTSKFTLITICNFDKYQNENSESDQVNDQPNDQRPTSKRPATDQQSTTTKEIKNIRKYIVVVDNARELDKNQFLKEFFAENRRAALEQLIMSRHFGSLENFKRLASQVVAEWEATEEKTKTDLNDAYKHLVSHCARKQSAERSEERAGARTNSAAANRATDKAPRNVNDQWNGIQMPTH